MTQRNQKGFSIIELLIVVAIIAILILVALPQYQRYILRAQVSEGMSLAAGPKTELGVLHAEFGQFPADSRTTSVAAGTGKYIDSSTVTSADTLNVTIAYRFGNDANADIAGQWFEVTGEIDSGNVTWGCRARAGSDEVEGALPAACR